MGVNGIELAWFTNYLTNYLQRVKIGGTFSDWGLVKGGIPQGSALGPLLFLIYMNMMARHVYHGKLFQYADDTVLLCSGVDCQDVHQQTSEDLGLLFGWIELSKMRLNLV